MQFLIQNTQGIESLKQRECGLENDGVNRSSVPYNTSFL